MVLETMTLAKVLATVGSAVKFGAGLGACGYCLGAGATYGAEHCRKTSAAINRGMDKFLAGFKAGQKDKKKPCPE